MFSDCVPDPAEFEANSDMAKLCAKVRRMFLEAEKQTANQNPGGASEQVLAALGINVGEKVMVGGVKVSAAFTQCDFRTNLCLSCFSIP